MLKKIIIGSRESKLAMIQSKWVQSELAKAYPDLEVEIKGMSTKGDEILDVSLSKIGDKGLFTEELENALLKNEIDLAVHSMKDLPTTLPSGLEIACTSVREDIRDVLCLSKHAKEKGINSFTEAKTIATSSLRRVAQLKRKYPHIDFVDIRGNLGTRFRKLDDAANNMDGMILAAAGIKRLAESGDDISVDRITEYLDPKEILPAVGQGALAIEISIARDDVRELLQVINSKSDEMAIKAERSFLRSLEGGCQVPIGAYTEVNASNLSLSGMVSSLDGSKYLHEEISGKLDDAEDFGKQLAQKLIAKGANEILKECR